MVNNLPNVGIPAPIPDTFDFDTQMARPASLELAVWSKPPMWCVSGDYCSADCLTCVSDWERLGNANWNWNNYQKFNEGLATFYPNEDGEINKYAPGLVEGYLWTRCLTLRCLPSPKRVPPVQVMIQETLAKIGIPPAPAPIRSSYGSMSMLSTEPHDQPDGSYVVTGTLDPATNTRSYAPDLGDAFCLTMRYLRRPPGLHAAAFFPA
ncbi:hypothetical protein BDZ89DRAFT_1145230 [Hymenopellis radicata]|nr:hypothetical protein BDZ89DRAFT_1145230 [Hymenopellis radicata]